MKNFEEFKASREKMDPAARKMTEHQWQQAYEAYCRTRQRTRRRSGSSSSSAGGRTRSSSAETSARGSHQPGSATPSLHLRQQVRQQSAYADLRLIVDVLGWVAIGMIVLMALIRLSVTYDFSFVALLLSAAFKILVVFVARMLAQVLIDIPDITIYRMVEGAPALREEPSEATVDD